MGNMGFINRLIFPFSPKLALEREQWRQVGLGFIRGAYNAADRSPRSVGWNTSNGSAEMLNQGERDIVRARARDMERNSDIMASQLLAFERNVVGTGIVLQSKILGADGKEDDALNEQVEELWKDWCLPENCEITGRWSLSELLAMVVRRRYVDGAILILMVYVEKQLFLQLLEVDDLDSTVQTFDGRRVVGGIEINQYKRPVAFHFRAYDMWGVPIKTQRITADRVIYLSKVLRPSQIREFSQASTSLSRIDDTNELIDAAIEKERVLSYLSVAIESDSNTAVGVPFGRMGRGMDMGAATPEASLPLEMIDQGTMLRLKPGEKVSTISQAGTSAIVEPIVKTTQRLAGGAAGLSYEVVSRDMSEATYSSARQGQLEDRLTYGQIQIYLVEHLCNRVYEEWLGWMVLNGKLTLPGYFSSPRKYRRHQWITSGWDWIDPLKEVSANAKALETHQTTLQEICASKGKDYRDVLRQQKTENELILELTGGDDNGQGG